MTHIISNPVVPIVDTSALSGNGEVIDQSGELKKLLDPELLGRNPDVKVNDLYLPNFSVRSLQVKFPHEVIIQNGENEKYATPGFGLFFNGSFKTYRHGNQNFKVTSKGEQDFLFDPYGEVRTSISAHTPLEGLLVVVKPNYFAEILPENEKWADDIKAKMSRKELIHNDNSPLITIEQQRAIRSVFQNPMSGKMRVHMQEASLLQILLHHLQKTFLLTPVVVPKINKRDQDVMRAVKDHITRTFTEDHSLLGLSKHFGINQNKLTTSFRQIFGVSVFEYISTLRMEYAKKLLEHEGLRVKEIAPILGYKNPHHFTAAFKKKFGVNPSRLR
jgi:AraC-like DNA-binding protein